ncbi:WD40 repeat domain-containing protein [Parathermosynechococcus lividus]
MAALTLLGCTQLQDYITAVAWGDRYLLAASAAGDVYRIDPLLGEQVILQPATEQSLDVLGVAGDRWAAAGQQGRLIIGSLCKAEDRRHLLNYGSVWIDQLAWHPHHPWVAFSLGHYVQVWDAAAAEVITTLDFGESSVLALAWQPTGETLAVAGYRGIQVWAVADWDADPLSLGFMSAAVGLAWSPQGDYLAASNMDHTLFVWRWGDQYPWQMQGFPGKVRNLNWLSPTLGAIAPRLLTSSQEGIILWQFSPEQDSWQPNLLELHRGTVRALSLHPNGQGFASSGDEGWLCLWQQLQPHQLLDAGDVSALAWHPLGHYLAAGGCQGQVWVWSDQAG